MWGSHVVSPKLHHTWYSMLLVEAQRWPIISSMNHSLLSGAPKSYGSGRVQFRNNESFDAGYGRSNETWNVGLILHCCRVVGSSITYVHVRGRTSATLYGPMYLGHNFLAHPFGRFRFFVSTYTRSSFSICGSSLLLLLTSCVWNVWVPIMASCASAIFCNAVVAKSFIPLATTSPRHNSLIIDGIYPPLSSNGAYPSCCCGYAQIYGEFGHIYLSKPVPLIGLHYGSEYLAYVLIRPFCLPICLWVKQC